VEPVLDELAARHLLSDGRFAEAYVTSRASRGFGPVRIDQELVQRGIDVEVRRAACEHRDPRWCELAGAARRKRFGPEPPSELRERARQVRFLAQRGFTREQIAHALDGDPDEGA
jgi:regulatory protein